MAIDPGRAKCGLAVVRRVAPPAEPGSTPTLTEVLHQQVTSTTDLDEAVSELTRAYSPDVVIVGNGTTSAHAVEVARGLQDAPVELVEERFTSLLARKRYFRENPPRGLRRLIPTSLQNPPRPHDDYVAVILAERYLLEVRG
ncbi:MAG: hypothetical protein A2Z18_10290 [Armatimonadetes bacterium RBG_16_58_9]|nr:MAG: hypothetical protein A2Z18_10290 [Armatimonadetes bacterium RBG_16_58_9]